MLHIPTVFGAVTLAYNLADVKELKLDADTVSGIFLGSIAKWNDPKLAALNPGVTLPDKAIQVVHRSDSSGTTNIFTSYLAAVSPEWKGTVGSGKEVKWPVGVGGQGNKGVAAVVQQQPGSMGYVELSYAAESQLPVAQLRNKAGTMVTPSLASTSAAAEGVTFPADLRFSLIDSAGAAGVSHRRCHLDPGLGRHEGPGQGVRPQGLDRVGPQPGRLPRQGAQLRTPARGPEAARTREGECDPLAHPDGMPAPSA